MDPILPLSYAGHATTKIQTESHLDVRVGIYGSSGSDVSYSTRFFCSGWTLD